MSSIRLSRWNQNLLFLKTQNKGHRRRKDLFLTVWYTFPFQSFTLSNDSNSISVPEPGRLRETLTPAAAVLSLVWTLFQHVGPWQVNLMRCNNKGSVTAAIANACARAAGSPLNWLFIPVTDIYYVCVRKITSHSHTHTHPPNPSDCTVFS